MLTPKQETFAQQYLATGNASEAYRTAYPKAKAWLPATVHSKACLTLRNGKVVARLAELRSATIAAAVMDYREALEAVSAVARSKTATARDRLAAIGLLSKLQGWEPTQPEPSTLPIRVIWEDPTARAIHAADRHPDTAIVPRGTPEPMNPPHPGFTGPASQTDRRHDHDSGISTRPLQPNAYAGPLQRRDAGAL